MRSFEDPLSFGKRKTFFPFASSWLVKRWINLVSCVLWTLVPIHYDTPKRNRRSTNFFSPVAVAGLECIYPSREETSNSNYDRYCGNETKKSLSHRHVSRCDRGNYQQTTEPAPVHAHTFDVFGYTGNVESMAHMLFEPVFVICRFISFVIFACTSQRLHQQTHWRNRVAAKSVYDEHVLNYILPLYPSYV